MSQKKKVLLFLYWFLSLFYSCKNNSIECKHLGRAMVINDLKILNLLENEEDKEKMINYYMNDEIKKLSFEKL